MSLLRAAVRLVITVVVCIFAVLGAFALWATLEDTQRAREAHAEYVASSRAYEVAIIAYNQEIARIIAELVNGALENSESTCVGVDDALLESVEAVWKRLNTVERATRIAFIAESRRTESNVQLLREYHLREILIEADIQKIRPLLEEYRRAHESGEVECIDLDDSALPKAPGQRL